MEESAGSFSGTAANVVALAEEPWVLKSFTSVVPSQSSLLLWVGVALNGILLLRSQIGKAFSAQISSFVE